MNYDYELLTGAPTRQCLICKCKEQPRALFVDFGAIWLCDDCKPKMSEQEVKQIEEMMQDFGAIYNTVFKGGYKYSGLRDMTERLYNAGYRKQKEGEWKRIEVNGENYGQVYYQHKDCKVNETQIFQSPYHFCPNCGAHMKGGAE